MGTTENGDDIQPKTRTGRSSVYMRYESAGEAQDDVPRTSSRRSKQVDHPDMNMKN